MSQQNLILILVPVLLYNNGHRENSVHQLKNKVRIIRKKPGKTNTNAAVIFSIFNKYVKKKLNIILLFKIYNIYIGNINIFD